LFQKQKNRPVGGFIESRKMFSGTSPEGENCSQAIFTNADLLEQQTQACVSTPVYVA